MGWQRAALNVVTRLKRGIANIAAFVLLLLLAKSRPSNQKTDATAEQNDELDDTVELDAFFETPEAERAERSRQDVIGIADAVSRANVDRLNFLLEKEREIVTRRH